MKQDLKDFINKNKPQGKKSKLDNYKIEIADLKIAGYSYEQIKDYLILYKRIKVDKTTICKFYNKIKQENHQSKNITSNNIQEQNIKDIKPIPNQNQSIATKEKSKEKTKIVQLEQKKDPNRYYPPPPKTISDEEFLTLCDDDQITYCYKLYCAGYEEEGDRLLKLPGVDSISRTIYRAKKRDLYERTYFKERKDLDMDD